MHNFNQLRRPLFSRFNQNLFYTILSLNFMDTVHFLQITIKNIFTVLIR